MRLKFLGSRELPGEGQRLVGVPRRSLRIFQDASARLQQTPRGSQEVAGGSLEDPSRLTGGSQELPGCSHETSKRFSGGSRRLAGGFRVIYFPHVRCNKRFIGL